MTSHERERLLAGHSFRLVLATFFLALLLADPVGRWVGWHIFYFTDPILQWCWTSVLLVLGTWSGLFGGMRTGMTWAALAGAAGLYAYGAYAVVSDRSPVLFLISGSLFVMTIFGRLLVLIFNRP